MFYHVGKIQANRIHIELVSEDSKTFVLFPQMFYYRFYMELLWRH
jgi:hypothetical protein